MEQPPPKVDKSNWPKGLWNNEPDRVEFEYNGFPCLARRNSRYGFWCGYVAVPPGHPYFKKDIYDVPARVHGGLTYAEHCSGDICHVPKPGEPDNVWWLGFDCGHWNDFQPGMEASLPKECASQVSNLFSLSAAYRDLKYTRRQIRYLADQIAEAA